LTAQLRQTCGALPEASSEVVPSFWHERPDDNFPPPFVRTPEEFGGAERINIACTQTGLPVKAQRELVARWCEALPTFRNLRYVWFQSKVTQNLFEAACKLPQLEGLYVKWSAIEDLAPLVAASELQNLHLGSSVRVKAIEPLTELKRLVRLDLDNLKEIRNLTPIGKLTGLVALGFTGAEFKRNTVESLEPLGNLHALRWLHIGSLRTDDHSLRPLARLKALEYLAIGNVFSVDEFAWLSVQLPNTACSWLQPYQRFHNSLFPCPKCKQNWRVMPSGQGAKLLCPTCDAERLAEHVRLFERLRAQARTA
jgi:hypothetical protein